MLPSPPAVIINLADGKKMNDGAEHKLQAPSSSMRHIAKMKQKVNSALKQKTGFYYYYHYLFFSKFE
jgi:hypothetical protein